MHARSARPADAAAMAAIYNQGIEERQATFEARLRSPQEVAAWFDGVHAHVVIEENGEVIAFAATSTYRPRECYSGIAELSVYVARQARRRGAGRLALETIMKAAAQAGYWKLVSRVFPDNAASRALLKALAFREVGIYEKHGRLDGVWKDVVIVERLLLGSLPEP
jgi:phosphinothricin acetyltransferase